MKTKTESKESDKKVQNVSTVGDKPKSKIALYWESDDRLDIKIIDMKAVLK